MWMVFGYPKYVPYCNMDLERDNNIDNTPCVPMGTCQDIKGCVGLRGWEFRSVGWCRAWALTDL